MAKMQSAERVSQLDKSDNFVFQRSLLAYHKAAEIVSGRVLEIGTGSGYGMEVIAPAAEMFATIDKFPCPIDHTAYPNVEHITMTVPPLEGIESGSFDFVIMFQVIEHIKDDFGMMREIHRVLKTGGHLVITTPNSLMSLTRNPWHIREYTPDGFMNLTESFFPEVETLGVFGNEKVMEYYQKNRIAVERIRRFDPLGFEKWMPRKMLQIPYDILNRINRRRLLKENTDLTSGIAMEDYFLKPVDDSCFDLFYIARK